MVKGKRTDKRSYEQRKDIQKLRWKRIDAKEKMQKKKCKRKMHKICKRKMQKICKKNPKEKI